MRATGTRASASEHQRAASGRAPAAAPVTRGVFQVTATRPRQRSKIACAVATLTPTA